MILRLDIAYDGSEYFGWQRQPNTDKTIQSQLEIALRKVFQQNISTIGSGRTDAGVSAYQQVVHFEVDDSTDMDKYKVCSALNSLLPESISVSKCFIAPDNFHALLSAEKKYYVYRIYTYKFKNALLEKFHLHHYKDFNLSSINRLSEHLVGTHDFKSFQSAGTPVPETTRELFYSFWKQTEENVFEYHIQGSGFLKQMVRNIVGTLLLLESKHHGPEHLQEILDKKSRPAAGPTVAAKGLSLKKVFYPEDMKFEDISR